MQWFSKNAVLFSLKTCLAAFLALYIALELNLDKPAWALTTVYVSSQLYSAATISKSVFRLMGTLLGGIFIFLIYPETVQSPILFSLCVSLWVSVCLYLSLLDRTPKSYVFMLAGYSAAIMGFPGVTMPLSITETVISRIEEITLGVTCSSVVHRLLLPVSMRRLLEQSVSVWYQNGRQLCSDLLTGIPRDKSPEREEILIRMAQYPQQVETLITHCVYEGDAARSLIRLISVQYRHLSYLIPTLTAIERRLQQLQQQQIHVPESVAVAFQQFLLWLNASEGVGDTSDIQSMLTASQNALKNAWRQEGLPVGDCLLLSGLLERLADFVRIAGAYQSVSDLVSDLSGDTRLARKERARPHTDTGLLLLSATTSLLATLGACLLWIGSGWLHGATAPMMAAILSSFFAGVDTPGNSMKLFIKGVVISIIISVIYVAVLIPQAITFEALIICLTPGLIALGLVIANPATNMIGLSAAVQLPGFIGLSHYLTPDLPGMLNTAIASMTGVLFAVVITALIRNKRPSWIARRAVRSGLRELLRFVKEMERNGASLLRRQQFITGMLERVNVILPRMRLDPHPDLLAAGNLVTEVWLGVNCYDYYARHQQILSNYRIDNGQMFHELARFLQQRMKSLKTMPHPDLLDALDQLLVMLENLATADDQLFTPLFHLYSLRLSLFPDNGWPRLKEQEY
ncbi:FUSC family protein [Erwinia endophytica]|uniref:FUSC family protein n=1 Tax=Erwinia endophytica TaxID=1563158 RepID=UPI001265E2CA|nr:FUSC family protein [Erwinia endophytica]KAB8312560.1 FUSC family protein [Erwinia endophytica]